MIEGLWVVRFLKPEPEPLGILNGVVVIETGRILGGDSGFLYIGDLGERENTGWPVSVQIIRHDERVESIFGDAENYTLVGEMRLSAKADKDQPSSLILELGRNSGAPEILVRLTKAAELP